MRYGRGFTMGGEWQVARPGEEPNVPWEMTIGSFHLRP